MIFLKKNKKSKEDIALTSFVPKEVLEQQALDFKDIISPSAIKVSSKQIALGGSVSRTLFLVSYPRYLNKNWFAPIINLDLEYDISIFLHPMDTTNALRLFRRKVAQIEAQIAEREDKGLVRDPKLDTAHEDLERLRDNLQQAIERLFEVGVYITIYGQNTQELDKKEKEIRSILEARLVFIKPALFQQEQGFRSTVPVGTDLLEVHTKLNTESVSSFFPFISFNLSAEKGILYGINQHNSSLILFDRFSLPNYNSVIFATSGTGKSYATKLEVVRSLMVGVHVIVIDPENEYEVLARETGGRSFSISLSSEHHLNPFDLPEVATDEEYSEVLRSNIIHLVGFFRVILGELTPEEDAIIDKAITETYALKDIHLDSNFDGLEPPLLSDFEIVLSGIEGAESLVRRLSKYTKGVWSGFINQPTNIFINKSLIVFSIRNMEKELRPAAMHLITRFIWGKVRKDLRKRLLVVDEAWIMMQTEDTASFLYGMVKRGRKYYLGVASITQDVSDFLRNQYGAAILTNSSMVLLLRQSPTTIDLIQNTFNLTDEEKFILLEASVGEGIFIAGLRRIAIKVIASYVEDQIVTSNPQQVLEREKKRDKRENV